VIFCKNSSDAFLDTKGVRNVHRVARFRHFRNLQSKTKGVLGESI
jgi:hypothetical protein